MWNNGGRTRTHALLVGSPAINAGDPNFTTPPSFDQREKPFVRTVGGLPPFISGLDIGAYERQSIAQSFFRVEHLIDENDGNTDFGKTSLREAIAAANGSVGPDTITFASALSGTIELVLGELEITDSVTLLGPGAEVITIDAGGSSRIFNITDDNPANVQGVVIDGLTLTGGHSTGDGGAILALEQLTLRDSVITGNSADDDGGALFLVNYGSPAMIENTTFSDNTAVDGGAVNSIFGAAEITGSTFQGNDATGGGGALRTFNSTLSISESSFIDNTSVDQGGAIDMELGGGLSITDSTFDGNMTTASTADGGAIQVSSVAQVSIDDSTFSNNSAGDRSGAIHTISTPLAINASQFVGNSSVFVGGALATSATSTITDSSFIDNSGSHGGAFASRPQPRSVEAASRAIRSPSTVGPSMFPLRHST